MATDKQIFYKAEYKYQLSNDFTFDTPIKPTEAIKTDFIHLDITGELFVKKSYAWDGPSGPVVDTNQNMRASLVHDALYQLMRNENLSRIKFRKAADRLFRDICIKDGVSKLRAFVYYFALRKFGEPSANPQNKKKVHCSPKV